MAYIAYAAFNAFPRYAEMDYASDNPQIGEALKRIAFINIKKVPGGKSSYPPEIAAHFRRNRALLLRQIELYSPDVVIGGGTLRHFYSDLGLSDSMFNKDRSAWHCTAGDRLLIHANHPAQRGSVSRYVDDIGAIIKKNWPVNVRAI